LLHSAVEFAVGRGENRTVAEDFIASSSYTGCAGLSDQEIVSAFALILGRAPEADALEWHRQHFPTMEELRRHLLRTDEFRSVYAMLTEYTRDQTFDLTRRRAAFVHIPKTGGTSVIGTLTAAIDPARIFPDPGPDFPDRYRLSLHAPALLAEYDYFLGHYALHEIRYIPGEVYTFTVLREPRARLISQYYFHRSRITPNTPAGNDFLLEKSRLPLKEYLRDPQVRADPAVDNAQCRALFSLARPRPADRAPAFYARACAGEIDRSCLVDNALENLAGLNAYGTTDGLDDLLRRIARDLGFEIASQAERKLVTDRLPDEFPGIYTRVEPEVVDEEVSSLLDELVELDERLYRAAKFSLAGRRRAALGPDRVPTALASARL
jgi:hypothetical protein